MKLLALDTSTMLGSIALSNRDILLAEYHVRITTTYSDTFFLLIDHLLHSAHLTVNDLDGYVVAMGPGSFTALRIGISIIKGLSMATNKPVIGVPSLDGLANNICTNRDVVVCPLIDARRGEVYTALYKGERGKTLRKITTEKVVKLLTFLKEINQETIFLGDGVDLYGATIYEILKEKSILAPLHLRYPKASSIIQLALPKFKRGEYMKNEKIAPLYVRPPEAELKEGGIR